jgi:hypothetical protein
VRRGGQRTARSTATTAAARDRRRRGWFGDVVNLVDDDHVPARRLKWLREALFTAGVSTETMTRS